VRSFASARRNGRRATGRGDAASAAGGGTSSKGKRASGNAIGGQSPPRWGRVPRRRKRREPHDRKRAATRPRPSRGESRRGGEKPRGRNVRAPWQGPADASRARSRRGSGLSRWAAPTTHGNVRRCVTWRRWRGDSRKLGGEPRRPIPALARARGWMRSWWAHLRSVVWPEVARGGDRERVLRRAGAQRNQRERSPSRSSHQARAVGEEGHGARARRPLGGETARAAGKASRISLATGEDRGGIGEGQRSDTWRLLGKPNIPRARRPIALGRRSLRCPTPSDGQAEAPFGASTHRARQSNAEPTPSGVTEFETYWITDFIIELT
jgi:hypothetical protein